MKVTCHATGNTFLLDNSSTTVAASGRAGATSFTSNLLSVIKVTELACQHFYHLTDVR